MGETQAVLDFWFVEHGPKDWFSGDAAFDQKLAERFAGLHAAVALGEAVEWRSTPEGRLAEIIVLDQFSRQLHRGSPRAFATDGMALVLAQEAVAAGLDAGFEPQRRQFFYMPFMHSESLAVHEWALPRFETLENPDLLSFEMGHLDLIRRFGRYPMRNKALGRTSTPEEIAYMAEREGKMF